MTIHGYELTGEWKNSQCGKTATAKKDGKDFFIKKYQTPVAPLDNGTLDAKTFAHNKEMFEKFVDTRKRINSIIRTLSGPGGNIIIPSDEFIDGNQYLEAAEYVEGVVSDEELEDVLNGLSVEVKQLLMQTAAGALFSVHSKHVVHSDLKLQNVLLVRNSAGNYVAKLIDFDSSYFVDEKPDEVVGTIDYYSPELGAYADAEDDREEMGKNLTEKSDIFSLGLIFHFYLSGALPEPISLTDKLRKRKEKGKVIYCWVALNSGCELQISPKIKSYKFVSLIRDMLDIDPSNRPSASEVLKRLKGAEPVIGDVWPEHSIVLDKEKLASDKVVGLQKVTIAGQKKYEVLYSDGKKAVLSKDDLASKKYVKIVAPVGFCEPWEGHNIKFDLDKIKTRGFVSGEKKELNGAKGYVFYRPDSSSNFFKVDMLIAMKYASKITPTDAPDTSKSTGKKTEKGEGKKVKESESKKTSEEKSGDSESATTSPWPEHNIEFDQEQIKLHGYLSFKQDTLNGIHGYKFVRNDKTEQFIRVEMVILQKMARKL